MTNPGDAISVSLDEIALTLRAIAGRRTEFPEATSLAMTQGPAAGASQAYRRSLNGAAQSISSMTKALSAQLSAVEQDIATTGQQLVASDESASADVASLNWILGTVEAPVAPPPPTPSAQPGPSGPVLE